MHGNQAEISVIADSHYHRAIIGLSKMIQNPDRCNDTANLSATIALTLYEVSVNKSSDWP
jgi:uncharacterized membrane protein